MKISSWSSLYLLLGFCLHGAKGREPFKARNGSIPFVVYFMSRYRGLCVGTLVSRMAVLTAAVCVTNPKSTRHDTRPINVVVGTSYRHPRRGIRVQVTKILIPNFSNITNRLYLMEKSTAILLLKHKIPAVITEVPLRALDIDYKKELVLSLQEECLMPGWHFFYRGITPMSAILTSPKANLINLSDSITFVSDSYLVCDKVYPVHKFLLQRNLRVQFLNIVKKNMWCDALSIKFQKALFNEGFSQFFDKESAICVRDPDKTAQPCHGMYGAPLVCQGRAVAMLMAPDAQWTNCTGYSNTVHLFSSAYLRPFMTCVSSLFDPDIQLDWNSMKKAVETINSNEYDYLPQLYDKVASSDSTSTEEV